MDLSRTFDFREEGCRSVNLSGQFLMRRLKKEKVTSSQPRIIKVDLIVFNRNDQNNLKVGKESR